MRIDFLESSIPSNIYQHGIIFLKKNLLPLLVLVFFTIFVANILILVYQGSL
jgi:hypothetical protein